MEEYKFLKEKNMKIELSEDTKDETFEVSDTDSSDDENNEIQDEFEYGRIEPTDPQKDYTIFEIGHFAYKLKLRKFSLLYRNHHRKGIFNVLEMGYGIKFTNNKNACFNHSEVDEENEFKVCYTCKSYATQNTRQEQCTKCLEALTSIKVNELQTSMVVDVCLYLFNTPE